MRSEEHSGYCEPAATVIERFDGARALASLLKLDKSTVCQWRVPKARGGTDGIIPGKHHAALLRLACQRSVPLRPEELVPRPKRHRAQPSEASL
jgi:hypothetical protein